MRRHAALVAALPFPPCNSGRVRTARNPVEKKKKKGGLARALARRWPRTARIAARRIADREP
eukprot:11793663-Alexandrium_andersonii.AAC.1